MGSRKYQIKFRQALYFTVLAAWIAVWTDSPGQTVNVAAFGVRANSHTDATPGVLQAIESAKSKRNPVLLFPKGRYDFWPEKASRRHYFISNHDSVDSRAVAMPLEGFRHLLFDGQGSLFVFHGLMLPISITGGENIRLRNFSIDYQTPHIISTTAVRAGDGWVDLRMGAGERYIIENNHLYIVGEGWKHIAAASEDVDGKSKAVAWNSHAYSDFAKTTAEEISPGLVRVRGLPVQPAPGNILILWNEDRPDPAIWVSGSKAIAVTSVNVHSALGMGFLAQRSEDIHLDGFSVQLSERSTRYITTNADAVHFSGCRGKLTIENGLYENMLDDGINVHGTYLRVAEKITPDSILLEWPHFQTFGFVFAVPGEHLRFVKANTLLGYGTGTVKSMSRPDARHIVITFASPLPREVLAGDVVDNIDWQPTVIYRNNIVRRNRSRGTVFKTPKGVLIEGNTFDHLSGAAVLLAADASTWFESTPSEDVVIRHNRFLDQVSTYGPTPIFIRARVSLSAEPGVYNFRNIRIESNEFDVFQRPLLEATSVDGLIFRGNKVRQDHPSKPMVHPNAPLYTLRHARCIDIGPNQLPWSVTAADVSKQEDTKLSRIDGLATNITEAQWLSQCRSSMQSN